MYLLEFAAQGVKGCSPTTRAALKPGYTVLQPPTAEPVPLGNIATAVLFNDGRGGDAVFAAQPGAKVALTLQGNDLVAYRMLRELGGPGALHKLNKATQKFEAITSDALEMGQFLRGQVGLPQKSVFEHLFTLTPAQFPSKKPLKEKPGARPSGAKPALASAQPVEAASNVAQAEAKLKELQRELELSKEIDQLQFKQDGLQSQMFELESRLQGTEGLKLALQQAEQEYASAPTPESAGLPEDILARVERYPALVARRDEALSKLAVEKDAEEARGAGRSTGIEPLWRDMRFVAGVAVGVLCLAVALLLREGLVRYLALLDIPAFGFAALVALKWVDDLQGSQRVGRRGGMLAAREKKVVDEFEAEAAHVKSAMKALGAEAPDEVVAILGKKAALAERVQAIRGELEHAQNNPEFAQAAAKYQALKAESDAISHNLQERSGGYVRDAREVERELDRVRQSIQLAKTGAPSAPAADASPEPSGQKFEDPSAMLMSLATDLYQLDLPSLASTLRDRCTQYLTALCDRRYVGVEWDLKGNATLLTADRKLPATDLPPKDADLYFLALRLTLVEKYSAKGKLPFVLEDVLGVVGDAKHPLVARMLKHLGTLTQVLQVTSNPTYGPMADATVTL